MCSGELHQKSFEGSVVQSIGYPNATWKQAMTQALQKISLAKRK
jgi:hypothetical protein